MRHSANIWPRFHIEVFLALLYDFLSWQKSFQEFFNKRITVCCYTKGHLQLQAVSQATWRVNLPSSTLTGILNVMLVSRSTFTLFVMPAVLVGQDPHWHTATTR